MAVLNKSNIFDLVLGAFPRKTGVYIDVHEDLRRNTKINKKITLFNTATMYSLEVQDKVVDFIGFFL